MMGIFGGIRDLILAPMPTEHTRLTKELLEEQVDEWIRRSLPKSPMEWFEGEIQEERL